MVKGGGTRLRVRPSGPLRVVWASKLGLSRVLGLVTGRLS